MERPPSVIHGTDGDVLKVLLALHAPPNPRVLDVTYGRGVMWQTMDVKPWRNDLAPSLDVDSHHDFRRLPANWTAAWDCLIFDPPHITEVGKNARLAKGNNPYGLRDVNDRANPEVDIGYMLPAFAMEAKRVLVPGGVAFCKLKDGVHRSRFRWLSFDLKVAAEQAGFTCCSPILKIDPHAGRITGANWQQVDHPRTVHTWWMVLHNGPLCVARKNRRNGQAVPVHANGAAEPCRADAAPRITLPRTRSA